MSDAKERIINATIRVIAREGLVGTTTRKIADEAGVNLAMLHYYFGDKSELLIAVHEAIIQRVRDILLTQPAIQPGDDIRLIAERDLTAFWRYIEEVPEAQIAQYELALYALREPQSAVRARQQVASYSALVEERCRQISEITRQACSISFAELARFIISGIDGLTLRFLGDRDSVRAARDLQLFISAMLTLAYGFQPSQL
jgi:AcrR family transcriptional regulator